MIFKAAGLAVLVLFSTIQVFPQELAAGIQRSPERALVLIESDTTVGSGFLVTSTGIVVTAFSTLFRASRVTITTHNGEMFDTVTLLAFDRFRNLAVLKIDGHDFPFVEVTKTPGVKAGDGVSIVGYEFKNERTTLFSQPRIISSLEDLSGNDSIQFTTPVTETSGLVVLRGDGRVIGFATPMLEAIGGQPTIVASSSLRQILNSVDQTRPIFQWKGPSVTFNKKPLVGISGYWKSTNGNVYLVEDKGDQVNITNMSSPKFRYQARWEGDLLVGIGYNDDKKRFVLRMNDVDHILRAVFKFESKDDQETVLQKARKEIEKPDDIWIRLR